MVDVVLLLLLRRAAYLAAVPVARPRGVALGGPVGAILVRIVAPQAMFAQAVDGILVR